jgi:Uma2 family endonuclease
MTLTTTPPTPNRREPAWEIARLFPNQGEWTEGDYLTLNRWTNRPVELADGQVEVLEMPTRTHQRLVLRVRDEFRSFCEPRNLGEALVAPYPVRLREGRFREPDVVFVLTEHADRLGEDFADGADLVVEVLSEDRTRDLVTKRTEYAGAGIAEYWIVDARERRVMVLRLSGGAYVVHGEWGPGERVESALLPGFGMDVDRIFSAAEGR